MRLAIRFLKAAALSLVASPVVAQDGNCPAGPGAAFGIVGYQCANCGFSRGKGQRASYSFLSEPVVVETVGGSRILAGDVIEAVNGQPITTRNGSDQFTYPAAGENTITVRRGRDHQTIRISVSSSVCEAVGGGLRGGVGIGSGAGVGTGSGVSGGTAPGAGSGVGAGVGAGSANGTAGRGAGAGAGVGRDVRIRGTVQVDSTVPLIIIDGVVQNGGAGATGSGSAPRTGKYGFAVACEPSCTAATDRDGALAYTYYKYDGPPPIVAIRAGSPTERAGVKIGDLLLKIDGRSIVDPEGALALARIDKRESVRLTIRRDGKDLDYLITVGR
jgi:hypothetical protein